MTGLDSELPRIRALLELDRYGGDVHDLEPEPAADDVGAAAAVAWAWDEPAARAVVYVFQYPSDIGPAEEALHAGLTHPSTATVSSSNGRLLLWATTLADSEDGVALVHELRSSFAGRERDDRE